MGRVSLACMHLSSKKIKIITSYLCRSRRIPRPIALNKDDNLQNSFLIYSAWIRCRVFGVEASVDDLRKELSRSDLIEEVQTSCAQIEEGTISEKIKEELVRVQAIHNYNDILKICSAEDFQKVPPITCNSSSTIYVNVFRMIRLSVMLLLWRLRPILGWS